MLHNYHENHTYGTSNFPLQVYSQHDTDGFYFVSQHWHEELEWIYMEYGVLHLTVHGRTLTLNPGDFCFINSGELHEIKSVGVSLHHAIVFDPALLNFTLYDACQHNFIRPVTSGKLIFPASSDTFSPQGRQIVLSHVREITRLYHERPTCAFFSIKIHLLQVLELLFQTGCFLENPVSLKEQDSLNKLKEVIEYIHQNYVNPISLQTLAEICYMSPNYFCHYFKREIGKPPIAFINEYRIQEACQLLTETQLPVSQIALSVGFDNFSYFIRKFREYKGVTPQKYRALCMDGQ